MTTVCTDGKVMAADGRLTGSFIIQRNHKKIFKLIDGSIIGFCGECRCWQAMVDWLNGGTKPEFKKGEFTGLILYPNGDIFTIDEELHKAKVSAPFAIGSGRDFAMGAMLFGAAPAEAVKVAIKLDTSSGGKVYQDTPKAVK